MENSGSGQESYHSPDESLEPIGNKLLTRSQQLCRPSKQPFLFELFRKAVVHQIFGLEAGEFFVGVREGNLRLKDRLFSQNESINKDKVLANVKDMNKVSSKLQVTLPKSIADRLNIKPGGQIDWEAAGDTIRVVPARKNARLERSAAERLKHFDRATERQREREKSLDSALLAASARQGRGWARADLYDRDTR